ncbi:MAG TPA: SDR family oxidoreductase [Candidatus Dormibacteraeota bacterium]
MDLGLNGRRALVTAASSGIGRACAEALVAEGAKAFIASRDPKSIANAADAVGAAGWSARDLSRAGDPEALVNDAVDRLGGLDIVVVNTGGPPTGLFESMALPAWEEAIDVVLMSAVRLAKAALPHLRQSDQGRIVVITSISVRQPIPKLVLSSSLRAGVTGMAKSLSAELAAERITVNCLAPDAIRTAALERLGDLSERERRAPMKRLGDPAEVGAACAFLCSRQAGYITGQTLGIDGGSLLGVH